METLVTGRLGWGGTTENGDIGYRKARVGWDREWRHWLQEG